jgi:hypothetical protein
MLTIEPFAQGHTSIELRLNFFFTTLVFWLKSFFSAFWSRLKYFGYHFDLKFGTIFNTLAQG